MNKYAFVVLCTPISLLFGMNNDSNDLEKRIGDLRTEIVFLQNSKDYDDQAILNLARIEEVKAEIAGLQALLKIQKK